MNTNQMRTNKDYVCRVACRVTHPARNARAAEGGEASGGAKAGSRSARPQPGAEGPRPTRWRVPCDRSGERMCSPGLLLELETDRLGASWCAVTVWRPESLTDTSVWPPAGPPGSGLATRARHCACGNGFLSRRLQAAGQSLFACTVRLLSTCMFSLSTLPMKLKVTYLEYRTCETGEAPETVADGPEGGTLQEHISGIT